MSRISREKKIWLLSWMEAKMHFLSLRMFALFCLLFLFICGGSWGLSDPSSVTSQLNYDTPYEILFLVSVFVLFSSTLGVVLLGFDGISKKRLTGELAIELTQPINRNDLARSQLQGLWLAVFIPTTICCAIGTLFIQIQIGKFPSLYEWLFFIISTGLIIFWYACIQLLASSVAKDWGSSVTLGIGVWIAFTLVWLLVTVLLAALIGVDVTDLNSPQYNRFSEIIDLLSPNGVYQLLLEGNLKSGAQPLIPRSYIWTSAILWSIIPGTLFLRRFRRLRP